MNSLRSRLFTALVVATGIIWMVGAAWIYVDSRARFERILDRRLMEAARMVDSLFDMPVDAVGLRSAAIRPAISYNRPTALPDLVAERSARRRFGRPRPTPR